MYGITETTVHVTYQALTAHWRRRVGQLHRPTASRIFGPTFSTGIVRLCPWGWRASFTSPGLGLARGYLAVLV